jgi:hypothetical protein
MSFLEPYTELIKEKLKDFIEWLKPNPRHTRGRQLLQLILKLPIVLLAILVSPIALIMLIFAFIAAL